MLRFFVNLYHTLTVFTVELDGLDFIFICEIDFHRFQLVGLVHPIEVLFSASSFLYFFFITKETRVVVVKCNLACLYDLIRAPIKKISQYCFYLHNFVLESSDCFFQKIVNNYLTPVEHIHRFLKVFLQPSLRLFLRLQKHF